MSDITLAVGDGSRRMTYAELAAVRGTSQPSAERLVRRRGWPRQVGNDGVVRVLVPLTEARNVSHSAGNILAPAIPALLRLVRESAETPDRLDDGSVGLLAELVIGTPDAVEVIAILTKVLRRDPMRARGNPDSATMSLSTTVIPEPARDRLRYRR